MWKWQFDKRTIRVLRVVTMIIVAVWLLLYILPSLLLRIDWVQREVGRFASRELSQLLGAEVEVERIGLSRGDVIAIDGIKLKDEEGRQVLRAHRLLGTFSWRELLMGQEARIASARLFDLEIELQQDPETGRLNIQHIIDHLSQADSTSSETPIVLNTLLIRDAHVRLLRGADTLLCVERLSTKIDLLRVAADEVSGIIDQLSAQPQWASTLEHLSAQVELRAGRLTLSDLMLRLPHSHLFVPLLSIDTQRPLWRAIERLELHELSLSPLDLMPWLPKLASDHEPLRLELRAEATEEGLSIRGLESSIQGRFYCTLPEGQMRLDADGHYLGVEAQALSWGIRSPLALRLLDLLGIEEASPLRRLSKLSQLQFLGRVAHEEGRRAELSGRLSSSLGELRVRLDLGLSGGELSSLSSELQTEGLQLGPVLEGLIPLDYLRASLQIHAQQQGDLWSGELEAELPEFSWAGESYGALTLRLSPGASSREHHLSLESRDPRALGRIEGDFSLLAGEPRDLSLEINIPHFEPGRLGLWDDPEGRIYELLSSIRLESLGLETPYAQVDLHRLSSRSLIDTLELKGLRATLSSKPEERSLSLESSWLNLRARGSYDLVRLPEQLCSSLLGRLPSLAKLRQRRAQGQTKIHIEARVEHLPLALTRLASLPLSLERPLDFSAHYDEVEGLIRAQLRGDGLGYGGYRFDQIQARLEGDSLSLESDLTLPDGSTRYFDTRLDLSLVGEELRLALALGRDASGESNGSLNLSAQLDTEPDMLSSRPRLLGADIRLSPSLVKVHGQMWAVSPASISVGGDSIMVQNLSLRTQDRSLSINGGLGSEPDDRLSIELERINLGYILSAIGVDFNLVDLDLTGRASGRLEGTRFLAEAELRSDSLLLDGYRVGEMDARLKWDSQEMNIYLNGLVRQEHGGQTKVDGYIRPADGAGIDLRFDADRLGLGFTSVFLSAFSDHVEGRGTGMMRLFGLFDEGVSIEGEVDVDGGQLGIIPLGTRYRFDHRLRFTPEQMIFDGLEIRDEGKGSARLDGVIHHRYFDAMQLDLKISDARQIKVLESNSRRGMPVYGSAYGSGEAHLYGSLDRLRMEVDLVSEAGTDVVLDFAPTKASRDDHLITFRPLRTEGERSVEDELIPTISPSGAIDILLRLKVTPEAKQTLRLGDGVGNELKGRTEGSLQIHLPYLGASSVYGVLNVLEGNYVFRLEQLAHKRFNLREGGRIDFRGDPMRANIDLQAIYALTANIADLDQELATEARRTNVPVHCLLELSGELSKPDIAFGIELPGAERELERRVRSLLHSEDAINRQMLYLIALGKFSPREDRLEQSQSSTTSNLAAVASSALSEQLSYLLGNLSQNVRIGTSIKTRNVYFEDTDIELLFSGSWFDDRLSIHGNVGYHDNPFLQNTYIGEFDLEYKLNRSGSLRLKAYNRYNNMYQYLRQSLTTQGLGLLLRQRFDSLGELFPWARRRTSPKDSPLPPPVQVEGK